MKKLLLLFIPLLFICCKDNANIEKPKTDTPVETIEETTNDADKQDPGTQDNDTQDTETQDTETQNTETQQTETDTRIPAEYYDVNMDSLAQENGGYDANLTDFDVEISEGVHFSFKRGSFHRNYSTQETALILTGLSMENSLSDTSNYFSIKNLPTDNNRRKVHFKYKISNADSEVIINNTIGTIPLTCDTEIHHFDYEYYGTNDFTFYPLLKAGSPAGTKIYIYDITISRVP